MRGLFGALVSGAQVERKTTDISALTWERIFGEPRSKSGVSVNLDKALAVTTVLSCARVLAEDLAKLPFKVFRETGNRKVEARDRPEYKMLSRRPNEWLTSFEFRESMMFHAVLAKGAFAQINRAGSKVELIPILPGYIKTIQGRFGDIAYEVRIPGLPVQTLDRKDVLHVRGPSWDTVCGLDVVQLAREAIGLAIATEESHAGLHSNGARPGGILQISGALSPDAQDRLRASWTATMQGVKNAFRTAILDGDNKWIPTAVSGVDSQHLETRRFQIEEVCRAMRVFPQMVGHTDKTATFASAEAFFAAHVVMSLQPWVTRWEQAVERDVFDNEDGIVAKMNMKGLLRGNAKDQAQLYSKALGSGGSPAWMTQDEVRELEDLDPKGGAADELPTPTNPAPAKTPADEGEDDADGA